MNTYLFSIYENNLAEIGDGISEWIMSDNGKVKGFKTKNGFEYRGHVGISLSSVIEMTEKILKTKNCCFKQKLKFSLESNDYFDSKMIELIALEKTDDFIIVHNFNDEKTKDVTLFPISQKKISLMYKYRDELKRIEKTVYCYRIFKTDSKYKYKPLLSMERLLANMDKKFFINFTNFLKRDFKTQKAGNLFANEVENAENLDYGLLKDIYYKYQKHENRQFQIICDEYAREIIEGNLLIVDAKTKKEIDL
jgi:hypothetical protein